MYGRSTNNNGQAQNSNGVEQHHLDSVESYQFSDVESDTESENVDAAVPAELTPIDSISEKLDAVFNLDLDQDIDYDAEIFRKLEAENQKLKYQNDLYIQENKKLKHFVSKQNARIEELEHLVRQLQMPKQKNYLLTKQPFMVDRVSPSSPKHVVIDHRSMLPKIDTTHAPIISPRQTRTPNPQAVYGSPLAPQQVQRAITSGTPTNYNRHQLFPSSVQQQPQQIDFNLPSNLKYTHGEAQQWAPPGFHNKRR